MGKVSELVITKGKTVKAGDRDEWIKAEYSVKAVVADQTDLENAKAHLEGLIDGWLTGVAKPELAAAPREIPPKEPAGPSTQAQLTAAAATALFPKELADMLVFEETKDWIVVKPRQYLGSENFAKSAAIVTKHKGEYISAGKESHFRFPRK